VKYLKIEESTLIITLLYLDRLCEKTPIELTDYNIHKYFIFNVG